MNRRTAILIQARSGSTRLPGKIFAGLPGEKDPSIIEHIYGRMTRVEGADDVAVLIPDDDHSLKDFLDQKQIPFLQGSALDVRKRYRQGALALGADWIVRVTGDNPCVDVEIASQTIDEIQKGGCDLFSFSNLPLGMAVEAMDRRALMSDRIEAAPEHREHVSLHIKHNPSVFRVLHRDHPVMGQLTPADLPRLTVDTREDLEVIREVFQSLGSDFGVREVLELLRRNPEIFQKNHHIKQLQFPASGQAHYA